MGVKIVLAHSNEGTCHPGPYLWVFNSFWTKKKLYSIEEEDKSGFGNPVLVERISRGSSFLGIC